MCKIYGIIAYLLVVFVCFVYSWYEALKKCTTIEHRIYVICNGAAGLLLGTASTIVTYLNL